VTAAGAVDTRVPTLAEVRGQRSQSRQFRHPEAKVSNIGQDPPAAPQPMLSQRPRSRSALSDEDLLNVLLLRQRAQQENRDLLKATQAAKDQEIGDLRDVSHNLYQQLQGLQEQDKEKGTEISRLHAIIPQWENRIRNLTGYVDTLAKNHRDLMRGSKELQKKHEEAEREKSALALMLKDVHESVEKDHRRYSATNKVLIEARHHIEVLEQTVENQERQSRENGDLLHAERDRNQRLEEGMTKLTNSYCELTTMVSGHPEIILENLSRVLEISIHTTAATQAQSHGELKSLLNQCVQMLKNVESTEIVKPQDFGKLDNSIRAYAHR
jgi:chromosome segregation ATPase